MKPEDLIGEWYNGRFEGYRWRCVCEEDLTWGEVCTADGRPKSRYYLRFYAQHDWANSWDIGAEEIFFEDTLEFMRLDVDSFKRIEFMRLFNAFLKKFQEIQIKDGPPFLTEYSGGNYR